MCLASEQLKSAKFDKRVFSCFFSFLFVFTVAVAYEEATPKNKTLLQEPESKLGGSVKAMQQKETVDIGSQTEMHRLSLVVHDEPFQDFN